MGESCADSSTMELAGPLFKGVKFYVSGEIDDQVVELLKSGGAERMNYFTDYVTHLICGRDAEDTDLSDANEVYEIPAITTKWVYMCVRLKRLVSTKAYLYGGSKLFSNLVFCLSRPENDLHSLWAIISYNGGTVQLNLDNRCTHLVTTNISTAKYMKAFSLGPEKIAIVTPDWIIESLRNGGLVQAELYHPRLIQWPKILKHESTTSITGFEPPDQHEINDKPVEVSAADSTQALLDKLKQRMPWNQPQSISTADVAPPNVVAPSYTQSSKLPNLEQMRGFNQQQQQLNLSSPPVQMQQQHQNPSLPTQQVPRSVVHHTAQPQQQFVHQQQPNPIQQLNLQQQNQLNLNRLIGQQQQQRPPFAQQLNKLNQMGQQSQFAQQLLQRSQIGQLNQQMGSHIVQTSLGSSSQMGQQLGPQTPVQQQQIPTQNQQNIIQRTALGQLNKGIGSHQHSQLLIQHMQQLGNRQHINQNQLLQNQQLTLQQMNQGQLSQQLNQNQQLAQQQLGQNHQMSQQQITQNQQLTQQQLAQQQLTQNQQLMQQQQQQNQQQLVQQQQQNQQQLVQQQQQKQQLVQNQNHQLTQNHQLAQQQQQQLNQNQQQILQSQQITQPQLNPNQQIPQTQLRQSPQMPQQQLMNQTQQNQMNQGVASQQQYGGMIQQQSIEQQMLNQTQQQQLGHKIVQNQFQQQAVSAQSVSGHSLQNQPALQQQQFVNAPSVNQQQQQFGAAQQQQQHFVQHTQQPFAQVQQQPQLLQGQQQQQQQFVQQQQQVISQQQQQQQIMNHQQMLLGQQGAAAGLQQQQQQPQQLQNVNFNQTVAQQNQNVQPGQQRPLWQQQQQLGVRHPGGIVQQTQGPRVQWSPTQQHRQFIQLDAQTHQQLQQMAPEQRAAFVAKLQRQRHQLLLQQKQQIQMQQQRGGHIVIRGAVPSGLNAQQQMQWLKQQGVVLQPNIQAGAVPAQGTLPQSLPHTPGLSPIQQHGAPQFSEQNQQQLIQRQIRLQQLQREQAQKVAQSALGPQQPTLQQANVVRPIGQPQPAELPSPNAEGAVPQHPLVNAKTKTALANMLSIRLQSGGSSIGPGPDNIAEPSAAGTLRLMTAQHNAALNSGTRPQDLLALQQQRRTLNAPAAEMVRPAGVPVVPPAPQTEPPKLQYSPRASVPLQHRPGTFYGHNPNLKLPPDLFLLGCIFVVVELERYLEESLPGWQQKIEKHGGEIEPQYCSRVTHVLCETQRHGVVMQALRDYKRCVTLYWLSDVINRKQVLPPWTALHLPTMYLDSTPASKHLISLSGFSGTERNRVKHMIKYTGASLTTYFSKHNTLLVMSKAEGSKYMHAKKWGTPVVSVQWLTDVMLGNFSALNQMEHMKYQQFAHPPNFSFDPLLVPNLMQAWKMPINISQESYERVKRSPSPVLMPKAKKMKTEHSTDENDNDTGMVPSMPHRILFSMCADVDDLKKIVRQLGGAVASTQSECTHLVMPQLSRTNKLLYCIARGIPIVPDSWLRDSHAANNFLDESNYTFDAKEFNSEYKCDFMQTLATKNRNKLLEGKFFYVTPSVFPSKKTVVELIQSSGGIVERTRRTLSQIEATNLNSPYSYVIITHEKDLHIVADLLRNKKEKVRVVCNVELILSAILKQTFEVEPFAVKIL